MAIHVCMIIPSTLFFFFNQVGTMAFEPALLEGGYVTDILLTISFDAEASEDAKLGAFSASYTYSTTLCM